MKSKIAKLLLVLSLAANVFLIYGLIDSGVTATHQGEALVQRERQLETLASVMRNANLTRAHLEKVAIEKKWETFPKETGLWINEVWFELDGETVKKVKFN